MLRESRVHQSGTLGAGDRAVEGDVCFEAVLGVDRALVACVVEVAQSTDAPALHHDSVAYTLGAVRVEGAVAVEGQAVCVAGVHRSSRRDEQKQEQREHEVI